MDILQYLYIDSILHQISEWLIIPVMIILVLLIVYALYCVGSLIVEMVVERRQYRAYVPELVARIEEAPFSELGEIVDKSGLLRCQKDDLDELIAYLYLPSDGRTEIAKRLLANQELRDQRVLDRTEVASKIAPMLGLMGTLIPLGPGIVALGTGDLTTLSSALLVAFDTTIAGLATAVVCLVVSRVRRRWYDDYLVSMEAAFNALLEKATLAEKAGIQLDKVVLVYGQSGKRASVRSIAEGDDAADDAMVVPDGRGQSEVAGGAL